MSKSLRHDLTVQMVKVEDLVPWERNPRQNDAAAERLAYTIQEQGWTTPILVQRESGRIIGGHTRLKAAIKIGLTEVPVIHLDVEDRQADAIAIADNRLGEIAEWDNDELARLLEEIEADGGDLLAIGYNDADWAELLDSLEAEEDFEDFPGDVEPEEPPEEPVSRLGEVYELGPHRLACGDSTGDGVALVMGDDKADAVWTDPPYGVAVVGGSREDAQREGMTIEGDALSGDELHDMLSGALSAALDACRPGAVWFVAAPSSAPMEEFAVVLGRRGLGVWRHGLVWVKDSAVHNMNLDYSYRHEPIFYGWAPGGSHQKVLTKVGVDSAIEVKRPTTNKHHPTMKPVELVEKCLSNHFSARAKAIVLDPFGGSGTTLLAAARAGCHARLVEMDPRFADVIRRRWTKWAREAGQDPGPGALD